VPKKKEKKLNNIDSSGKVFAVINGTTRLVIDDADLSSYAIVDILSEDTIVFATIDGQLKIWAAETKNGALTFRLESSTKVSAGKIFSMAVLSAKQILTCGLSGEMKLIFVDGGQVFVGRQFLLPESKEQRWFSCAGIVKSKFVAVGDRCGNLHFYW